MQEEVENRAVSFVISTTRLTVSSLIRGFQSYLQHRENAKLKKNGGVSNRIRGKQTVQQLIKQDQGVTNIDIAKTEIRGFQKVARKYGIDYAITKDSSGEIPKYLVFFKAKDTDAMQAAYQEYVSMMKRRAKKGMVRPIDRGVYRRPPLQKQLERVRRFAASLAKKPLTKSKERERSR